MNEECLVAAQNLLRLQCLLVPHLLRFQFSHICHFLCGEVFLSSPSLRCLHLVYISLSVYVFDVISTCYVCHALICTDGYIKGSSFLCVIVPSS